MRKTSLLVVAAMLLSTSVVFSNSTEGQDPSKKLKKQVTYLLSGYEMPSEKDVNATVLFTVNKEKEFVVLSVDTNDKSLEDYVKFRLNYRKIKFDGIPEGRRYTIPIRIVS